MTTRVSKPFTSYSDAENTCQESFVGNLVQHRIEFKSSSEVMQVLEGEYLEINSVPFTFIARYGAVTKSIYIRDCYRDLYTIATTSMLTYEDKYPVTLFTGVSGIGKSLFLIYFIFRFLNDFRFPDKRFAVEFERGVYHYFIPTNVEAGTFTFNRKTATATSFPLLEVPIFSDIEAPVEPQNHGKYLLIFSSPNPSRYKEKMKNFPNFRYTLPTWNYSELLFLEEDDLQWLEQFILLGGVPRSLFKDTKAISIVNVTKHLNKVLIDKGSIVSDYFFKNGFGNIDSENSHLLVHMNPPKSFDDQWLYDDELVTYSFASDEVFKKIVDLYRTQLLQLPLHLLNFGIAPNVYGGSTAGCLFEKICLWLKPIAGQQIAAQSFHSGIVRTIQLPIMSLLEYHWKRNARDDPTKQLQPNVLYQPKMCNLESGDAFCVIPMDHDVGFQLIALQITVSERHPIKLGGLRDIIAAFPRTIQEQICAKLLVFVTPLDGKLVSAQPFHTRQNKVAGADELPFFVQGFEQFIYRHSI